MSLTPTQLASLLEHLSGPAQIVDETGVVLAQNAAAQNDGAPLDSTHPLGGGLTLHRRPAGVLDDKINFDRLTRELLHEVRNPLSSILTATQLIRADASLDEETQMLLGVVGGEAARINRILRDFSTYLKMPPPQPAVLDVARLIRHLLAQLRREGVLAEEVRVEDDLPATAEVWADEVLVEYALSSVLRNAAEAMHEGGVLRVWRTDGEPPAFCVEDSGPGFGTESLQRAFDPFYSTHAQQSGLGLPIARAAAESSGGRIHLENRAGSTPGARVCLEFPAAQND